MASNSQNEIRLAPGVPVLSEGDIVLEGCVGEGAFGSVFRASYRGDAVAVKQLSRNATMLLRAYDGSSFGGGDGGPGGLSSVSEEADRSDEDPHDGDSPDLREELRMVQREIDVLLRAEHPNIIKFHGVVEDKVNRHLWIVTEFAPKLDLESWLRRSSNDPNDSHFIEWSLRLKWCLQTASALSYLHRRRILHRDIKSANLLLDRRFDIKLADFGFARVTPGGGAGDGGGASGSASDSPIVAVPPARSPILMSMVGSDDWMPPELLNGQPYERSVDIYSFGITMFEIMLCQAAGEDPIRRYPQDFFEIRKEAVLEAMPASAPRDMVTLAFECAEYEPGDRPTADFCVQRLSNLRQRDSGLQTPVRPQSVFAKARLLRSPHRRGSMAPVPVSEETLRARRKVLDGRRSPRTRSPPARGRGSSDGGSLLGGSLGRFPVIETGSGITALDFTSEEPPKGLSPVASPFLSMNVLPNFNAAERKSLHMLIRKTLTAMPWHMAAADLETLAETLHDELRAKLHAHEPDPLSTILPSFTEALTGAEVSEPHRMAVTALPLLQRALAVYRKAASSSLLALHPPGEDGSGAGSGAGGGRAASPQYSSEISVDDIKILGELGSGAFGEVYKARLWGSDVAAKTVKAKKVEESVLADLRNEIKVLSALHHPNIVLYMGASIEPDAIWLVMEFVNGGSLFEILHESHDEFSLVDVSRCALETALGMSYLHAHDPAIIHRDLKSPNILVDRFGTVKVCDFGLSTAKGDDEMACTPQWAAPEMARGEEYDEKVDVYAFGIVLIEMLTRVPPFWGEYVDRTELLAMVANYARPSYPRFEFASLSALIEDCLERAEGRPSFAVIVNKLRQFKEMESSHLEINRIKLWLGARDRRLQRLGAEAICRLPEDQIQSTSTKQFLQRAIDLLSRGDLTVILPCVRAIRLLVYDDIRLNALIDKDGYIYLLSALAVVTSAAPDDLATIDVILSTLCTAAIRGGSEFRTSLREALIELDQVDLLASLQTPTHKAYTLLDVLGFHNAAGGETDSYAASLLRSASKQRLGDQPRLEISVDSAFGGWPDGSAASTTADSSGSASAPQTPTTRRRSRSQSGASDANQKKRTLARRGLRLPSLVPNGSPRLLSPLGSDPNRLDSPTTGRRFSQSALLSSQMNVLSKELEYIVESGDLSAINDANERLIDTVAFLQSISERIFRKQLSAEPPPETPHGELLVRSFQLALDAAADSHRCSFLQTGEDMQYQEWFNCRTCGLEGNTGICRPCATTEHADHALGEARFGAFYCDCGASGNCEIMGSDSGQAGSDRSESVESDAGPRFGDHLSGVKQVEETSGSVGDGVADESGPGGSSDGYDDDDDRDDRSSPDLVGSSSSSSLRGSSESPTSSSSA